MPIIEISDTAYNALVTWRLPNESHSDTIERLFDVVCIARTLNRDVLTAVHNELSKPGNLISRG